MRILVTGSSGFLGANLLRHLPIQCPDWDLHATLFSIVPSDDMPNTHHLDLRDQESVTRLMNKVRPDIIFHTAALFQEDDPAAMYETNARGSGYLAREAAKHTARLIHLSSDVVFDGKRGNYSEQDPTYPITPYAVSKADGEREVLASGANAVIVRTSLLYGFKPLDRRTRAVMRGEMPHLFTDEIRCPIWVDNLSAALLELAENDYRGILHVAGSQALSRYDLGVKLLTALNADTSHLIPTLSAVRKSARPLDCSLDVSRAQTVLETELVGVDEVLRRLQPRL
jgi:dTDP-4-dehydrorhamnose reductase